METIMTKLFYMFVNVNERNEPIYSILPEKKTLVRYKFIVFVILILMLSCFMFSFALVINSVLLRKKADIYFVLFNFSMYTLTLISTLLIFKKSLKVYFLLALQVLSSIFVITYQLYIDKQGILKHQIAHLIFASYNILYTLLEFLIYKDIFA